MSIMRSLIRFLGALIGLTLVIILIYGALSMRPGAGEPAAQSAQLGPVEALEARYAELGIPLKGIRVLHQSPLALEITLQGSGDTERLSVDEQWWSFLAQREANLAYLLTQDRISSYNLLIATYRGETIDLITSFLHPSDLDQQLTPIGPAAIGDEETRKLLMKEWRLGGNEWLALDVQSDKITRPNTKYVSMEWTTATDSFEESRRRVQALGGFGIGGVYNIDDFNARHGAQIALVRVKVFDPQGNLLAHFIYDAETGHEAVWMAEGLQPEWMPRPAEPQEDIPALIPEPTSMPPSPTVLPTPYP